MKLQNSIRSIHLMVIFVCFATLQTGCKQTMSTMFAPAYTEDQISQLPKDMYNPKGDEVSEENFWNTIADLSADNKYVLVMAEKDNRSLWCDKKAPEGVERFWLDLKDNYADKVEGYVRVNVQDWSSDGKKKMEEMIERAGRFPSYMLVQNGRVVDEKTSKAMSAWCQPRYSGPKRSIDRYLRYFDEHLKPSEE